MDETDDGAKSVAPSDPHILYQLYGAEIRRYLTRRSHCSDTAAELTQETFLRLLRNADDLALDSPRAYLFRIAANLLTDRVRREASRPAVLGEDHLDRAADQAAGQERVLVAKQELRRLGEAVAALPPRRREIFILHKFDDLSYAEIAERLGISENTVMVQMMKALAHCRDWLADGS